MRPVAILIVTLMIASPLAGQSAQSACVPTAFASGEQGRVLFDTERPIYAAPGAGNSLAVLPGGAVFAALSSDPVCDGDTLWLPVEADGVTGWLAEAEGRVRHVEPWHGAMPDASDDTALPTGQILFVASKPDATDATRLTYGLYLVNADGSNRRTLLLSDRRLGGVSWSPDGTQIVYADAREGDAIYTLPVSPDGDATGEPLRLSPQGMTASMPVWSPDGSRVAFLGATPDLDTRFVYTVSADGRDLRRLTTIPGSFYAALRWNPNGQTIGFVGETPTRHNPLMVLPADDSAEPVIYAAQGLGAEYTICGFEWSPSGESVVAGVAPGFDCVGGSAPYYTRPGETELRPVHDLLLQGGVYAWGSQWLPDGERVTFTVDLFGAPAQVYAARPGAGDLQQLTSSPGVIAEQFDYTRVTGPAWSPDGAWLAVVWYRRLAFGAGSIAEIYLTDDDNSRYLPLLADSRDVGDVAALAWRPSGG